MAYLYIYETAYIQLCTDVDFFTSTLQCCTQFGFKSVLHRNIYWCLTEDKINDTCQNY